MSKDKKNHDKLNIKLIFSFIFYILYFIYEILESVFNYVLLHIKVLKKIIDKYKEKIYTSSLYVKVKFKVDSLNEKIYLSLLVFLIVSSALLIYIMPFFIENATLKIISIIFGKIFSTMNIILSSMGIKKIFKIPIIRLFRIKINSIKRKIKSNLNLFKTKMKSIYQKVKTLIGKNES